MVPFYFKIWPQLTYLICVIGQYGKCYWAVDVNFETPRLSPSLPLFSPFSSPFLSSFCFQDSASLGSLGWPELEATLPPQSLSVVITDTTHHAQLAKFLYSNTTILTPESLPYTPYGEYFRNNSNFYHASVFLAPWSRWFLKTEVETSPLYSHRLCAGLPYHCPALMRLTIYMPPTRTVSSVGRTVPGKW